MWRDHRSGPAGYHEKLSRAGFGLAALGDASFLGRLGQGSEVRLRTADKELTYVRLEPIGPRFLRKLDAFLQETGIEPHVPGEEVLAIPASRSG